LPPRFLLDTHIAVRWLIDARKLSREQTRVLEGTVRRAEPVALSAISLLEIASLTSEGKLKLICEIPPIAQSWQLRECIGCAW
jgi:PIN domain nuclease of toxin-antitoxin system